MRAFTDSNMVQMPKENIAYLSKSIKNKITYEEFAI
jgi:transcription elongation factor